MDSNIKISVCIPYYNRADMVMETIHPLHGDSRIDEIILCDDCSPEADFKKLLENTYGLPKVRIVKNTVNHHNQHNKRNALSFAKNSWVLLIDNDNVFGKDFIDTLYSLGNWDKTTIYHPSFASPTFDYRMFNGHLISRGTVSRYCNENIFVTLLNTNNYLVNRDEYLSSYQHDPTVRGADGIFFAYHWLKRNNTIHIVPDLTYFHRVHEGSEFLRESDSNMKLIYLWLQKVRELS